MISQEIRVKTDGTIYRIWDVRQIQTEQDAFSVQLNDVLHLGKSEGDFLVTWISGANERPLIFGGNFQGKNKWNISPSTAIVWGPRGISHNSYNYRNGHFLYSNAPQPEYNPYWDD